MKLYENVMYIFENRIFNDAVRGETDSEIGSILGAWRPDKSFRNNGRWVLCEFKVSAGPSTGAKVADDSLGV